MSNERRNITINVFPQGEGAWGNIAIAVLFITFAYAINSMAGCVARTEEARYAVRQTTP